MSTLVEFLLARIAEDEEAAYADIEPPPGYQPRPDDHPLVLGAARVLAECEAKQRIVALHAPVTSFGFTDCQVCRDPLGPGQASRSPHSWPCETLTVLALPYADHPDYSPEP